MALIAQQLTQQAIIQERDRLVAYKTAQDHGTGQGKITHTVQHLVANALVRVTQTLFVHDLLILNTTAFCREPPLASPICLRVSICL